MKDKSKLLYERALITCIIMLFLSIILKIFGVTWFNLNTNILVLKKIDNVVMNSHILSFIYSFLLLFINGYLVCIITTKIADIRKYMMPLSIICFFSIMFKTFVSIDWLSFIIDTLGLYSVCVIVSDYTVSVKEYIITMILNIIYQVISLFIRNLNYQIAFRGMIIGIIMNIDYYTMLLITYLYLRKGGINLCLMFHHFGSFLANQQWKKHLKVSKQCSKVNKGDC